MQIEYKNRSNIKSNIKFKSNILLIHQKIRLRTPVIIFKNLKFSILYYLNKNNIRKRRINKKYDYINKYD